MCCHAEDDTDNRYEDLSNKCPASSDSNCLDTNYIVCEFEPNPRFSTSYPMYADFFIFWERKTNGDKLRRQYFDNPVRCFFRQPQTQRPAWSDCRLDDVPSASPSQRNHWSKNVKPIVYAARLVPLTPQSICRVVYSPLSLSSQEDSQASVAKDE